MDSTVSYPEQSPADPTSLRPAAPGPPESDRWFKATLPRETLTRLSRRTDGEALRRIAAYFALLGGLGALSVLLWVRGSWWFLAIYGAYCFVWSFSNATGHEACHYTPFRQLWLNNALLYTNSWMQNWEPVTVRWVHARHHTYTSMVGDDAEYLLPNPIKRRDLANLVLGTNHFWNYNKELAQLAFKRPNDSIREAVPEDDLPLTARNARVFLVLYATVIGSCLVLWTPLPAVMLMLPRVVGEPMHGVLRALQHGGLETEAADHRRTTRSMCVSRPLQWLYCNMNFHIEHHMYPMVPFHALPELHTEIKDQLPEPTPGVRAGMVEIVTTMRRQRTDPDYRLPNRVPAGTDQQTEPRPPPPPAAMPPPAAGPVDVDPAVMAPAAVDRAAGPVDVDPTGVVLCDVDDVPLGDVLGVERGGVRYAVCRTDDGAVYAVDDTCTHHSARLSEGVLVGCEIECPMHQGRFDVTSGEATRRPAREPLRTHPVEVAAGQVRLRPPAPDSPADATTARRDVGTARANQRPRPDS
ncbi:MAG: fatty acid desaturase [Acidimicrobiaceae bacterium]|nr:fatty acid desaturase [Acidimicrobiaceae bacterium]